MMAKYKSGVRRGWKPYVFKITNNTHLQYLDPKTSVRPVFACSHMDLYDLLVFLP